MFHLFSIFWLYVFCIVDLCSVSCKSHHFLPAFCDTRGELLLCRWSFDQFGRVTVFTTCVMLSLAKKPFLFLVTISVVLSPLTLALAIDTGNAPLVT